MEEVLFKNEFVCTKNYYKECYKKVFFKKNFILNLILGISFSGNLLVILLQQVDKEKIWNAFSIILWIIILFGIELYIYFRNVNLSYSRNLEKNNGNCGKAKILITNKEIKLLNSLINNYNINLENVEKILRTENYYILVTKAKLEIPLKKDGFTQGTASDFEKFIKEKTKKKI